MAIYAGTVFNSHSNIQTVGGAYGKNVGTLTTGGTGLTGNSNIGITTDPTKSGIETSSSGLKLYFYVGETIQDANVIAASNALTDIANLKSYDYVVESYNDGFSWYKIYKSGWIEQGGYHTFSSNAWEAVTLFKPMKNNRYMALLTGTGTAETLKGWKVGSENKNTSTTLYAICANGYGVRWYVSGQGA